jgi:organic hydroperoxide reductase OsmC/OhrA
MELFENHLTCQETEIGVTHMSGTGDIQVGPPPAYGGSTDTLNPEELFVASINSCLMLVFYHFANQRKVTIILYDSQATGKVEKTSNGLRFTEIQVKATVILGNPEQSSEVDKLAELAEKYCLVSNSVACPIHYKVEIKE